MRGGGVNLAAGSFKNGPLVKEEEERGNLVKGNLSRVSAPGLRQRRTKKEDLA